MAGRKKYRFRRIVEVGQALAQTTTCSSVKAAIPDIPDKLMVELKHMDYAPILGVQEVVLENGQKCWALITQPHRTACSKCGAKIQPQTSRIYKGLCKQCGTDPLESATLEDMHDEEGDIIGVWCKGHVSDDIFRILCERQSKRIPDIITRTRWRVVANTQDLIPSLHYIEDTSGGKRGSFVVTFGVWET